MHVYGRPQGGSCQPQTAATGDQAGRRGHSARAWRAHIGIGVGMGSRRVERTLRDSHAAQAALNLQRANCNQAAKTGWAPLYYSLAVSRGCYRHYTSQCVCSLIGVFMFSVIVAVIKPQVSREVSLRCRPAGSRITSFPLCVCAQRLGVRFVAALVEPHVLDAGLQRLIKLGPLRGMVARPLAAARAHAALAFLRARSVAAIRHANNPHGVAP